MKTEKPFLLVISCVLQCIMRAITLTALSQYKIEVTIGGYTNPESHLSSCDGFNCWQACCDGFNDTSLLCHRCDSFFIYCLRNVNRLTVGCPEGGNTMRSGINWNDTSIDFSQNTVLGLDNSLVFQGLNDIWNGVQLYVRIWDQDSDGSQLIDVVIWKITQPVGVPSGKIFLTGLFEVVTMEVDITVLCVPGFTGMMCEEDIDDCIGVSCSGNGQCVDGVNSFTCNCTFGYSGVLCNETNKCVTVTCSGRGQCVDGIASYVCDCDAGFTGENCEINIDDCSLNPCGEGGQCVDGVDSFICMCTPGFTGELCQTNIDDCVGVNCSSNGECVDDVNTFTCECIPGYRGPLCAEVSFLQGNASGPIVGGVLGAFVALIFILILVVIVVVLIRKGRKGLGKDTQEHYYEGITSTTPRNSTANMIWDTNKSSNRDRSESAPDREFDNPIYGKEESENMYSVPELDTYQIGTGSTSYHKFDNPIYGDETT